MFRHLCCLLLALPAATETTISIQPDQIIREVYLSRILGTNAGLWYAPKQMQQLVSSENWKRWQPGLIRIPGGSWGDELVWNGNGVRVNGKLDPTKFINGAWQVDYSAYQPGFRAGANGHFSDYHGNVDVKFMHEFIRDAGASAVVTVNAGTGTPEMAAEWVRWAKANHYPVSYWEIGNELEGQWEQGHYRPDGKEMTPEIYAEIYRRFATAMKAVDPTIKVGGPTASNDSVKLASVMLEQAGELVDFVSYHTYPANSHAGMAKIFEETDSILAGMKKVRQLIRDKAPQHADRIEVGITEWHVGIHEGPRTVNQISGPWCAKWIGRMIEAGVDFANVWDLFSQTAQGGHGIFGKDETLTPRGPFWALALWNEHLGGTLVKCEITGHGITAFAAKREDGISLLLINESESEAATTQINLAGKAVTGTFTAVERARQPPGVESRTRAEKRHAGSKWPCEPPTTQRHRFASQRENGTSGKNRRQNTRRASSGSNRLRCAFQCVDHAAEREWRTLQRRATKPSNRNQRPFEGGEPSNHPPQRGGTRSHPAHRPRPRRGHCSSGSQRSPQQPGTHARRVSPAGALELRQG